MTLKQLLAENPHYIILTIYPHCGLQVMSEDGRDYYLTWNDRRACLECAIYAENIMIQDVLFVVAKASHQTKQLDPDEAGFEYQPVIYVPRDYTIDCESQRKVDAGHVEVRVVR